MRRVDATSFAAVAVIVIAAATMITGWFAARKSADQHRHLTGQYIRLKQLIDGQSELAQLRFDPERWIAAIDFQMSPFLRSSLLDARIPPHMLTRVELAASQDVGDLVLQSFRVELKDPIGLNDLVRWLVHLERGVPRIVVKSLNLTAPARTVTASNDLRSTAHQLWIVRELTVSVLRSKIDRSDL